MSIPVPEAVGLNWRKASRSATNGECVEVAAAPGYVAIRDSKNPDGAILGCPVDGSPGWPEVHVGPVLDGHRRILEKLVGLVAGYFLHQLSGKFGAHATQGHRCNLLDAFPLCLTHLGPARGIGKVLT